jgi:hypothetical protein
MHTMSMASNERRRILGSVLLAVDVTAGFHMPHRDIGEGAKCHPSDPGVMDDECIDPEQIFSG